MDAADHEDLSVERRIAVLADADRATIDRETEPGLPSHQVAGMDRLLQRRIRAQRREQRERDRSTEHQSGVPAMTSDGVRSGRRPSVWRRPRPRTAAEKSARASSHPSGLPPSVPSPATGATALTW